jgi:hypothetical protein
MGCSVYEAPEEYEMETATNEHPKRHRLLCFGIALIGFQLRCLGASFVPMDAEIAAYLNEGCKEHTRLGRCSRCKRSYTIGLTSQPEECLSLVPRVLPTMFAFYDRLCYYRVDALKGSYVTQVVLTMSTMRHSFNLSDGLSIFCNSVH